MEKELTPKAEKRLSMALSKILRHTALDHKLQIDKEGYILVSSLFKIHLLKKHNINLENLKKLVNTNKKKRFELTQKKNPLTTKLEFYIRALQGHSIKNLDHEKMLTKLEKSNPITKKIIVHGTFSKFWDIIKKTGLNKMGRNHVHMAIGYPGDKEVISGMRSICNTFIEIDIELALKNNRLFYVSKNNVVLTSGINGSLSPIFFKKVLSLEKNLKNGKINKKIIFENKDLGEMKRLYTYRYLLVLDFEANSQKNKRMDPVQEIIEFPIVVLDTLTNKIVKDKLFHYYVKPTETKLTPFITELTGITEKMIESGKKLSDVINLCLKFLSENFKNDEICFITCGDFDFKCLARETRFKKINLPSILRRYINIKEVFKTCFGYKETKCSMTDMLKYVDLELDGKHHSGIDDSRNIAKILQRILDTGFLLTKNFTKVIEDRKDRKERRK